MVECFKKSQGSAKLHNGMLSILYGSQTGTAEEVSCRISREAYTHGYTVNVCPMNDIDISVLPSLPLAVFVCSTTGEGEEPDNMKQFWLALRRKDFPPSYLEGMKYAVFGLGDSSYEQFNYPAKRLFRRLQQLGAVPLLERGDGDDQHRLGYEGALGPWLYELWARCGDLSKEAGWTLVPKQKHTPPALLVKSAEAGISGDYHLTNATLLSSIRITADDANVKDVRHLIFDCDLLYEPGDVAVLRPRNSLSEVEMILEACNWTGQADIPLNLSDIQPSFRPPSHIPQNFTLRQLFTTHLDINRPPSRYFFELLSTFVQDNHPLAEAHREKLLELGVSNTEDGQESYMDYVWRPKRKPAEVITDFGSLLVPIEQVFNLFPWIKPRSFSIASYAPGRRIEVVAALVRYKTSMKVDRFGVCSRWFEELQPGTNVLIRVDRGTMRPEISSETPMILMCSGTGLAPMLSIIQKTALLPVKPPVLLFFGCRKKEADALFLKDLQSLDWLRVFCEGSRDGPKGVAKVYLADILLQQSELVHSFLMHPNSQWFLSGNSKLPTSVKKALADIVNSRSQLEGESFVKNLVLSKRLFCETWS